MAVRTAEREQGNKINFLHQIFLHLLFRVYIYLFTLVKKCKYIITYVYIYMYVCVCFVRFFVFERKGLVYVYWWVLMYVPNGPKYLRF